MIGIIAEGEKKRVFCPPNPTFALLRHFVLKKAQQFFHIPRVCRRVSGDFRKGRSGVPVRLGDRLDDRQRVQVYSKRPVD